MSSASAAPTPSKQAPAPSQGKVAAAGGYEADESEWEHRDKENIHRGNVGAERKSTGAHGAKAKARPSGAAATSVQEASLRDKRPATAPGTSQRSRRAGAEGTAHGSHGPADSTREAGQCHEESVKGTEEDARRSTGVGAEGRARASVNPSSSSVFSGSRHTPAPSSSGLIRPATQSYGRAARRQDPVSSFLNTREQWKRGPAVTAGGTARGTVGQISSLQQPDVKNVWKAVHPLQNGTSASSYLVPTSKARTREREQVRQSLAWNEVYRPPKTDRVQVSWTLSKLAL
eukprot:Tamp_16264.p1 GENE.Tamp_16264~~Tamp_16264.p1  ORF type:complete len:319 (+),score=66.02 Tamp_16264:94-957(+)